MIFIVWIGLALIPFVMGKGALLISDRRKGKRDDSRYVSTKYIHTWKDSYIIGIIITLGITEAVHLMAVFLGQSFTTISTIWVVIILLTSVSGLLLCLLTMKNKNKKSVRNKEEYIEKFYILFGLSVLIQFVLLMTGNGIYNDGDMMVETVRTFISSGEVYKVNPLTGQAYELGLPLRIEILSLPTLYAVLSQQFFVEVEIIVEKMIPAVVLITGYLAYSCLGDVLFKQSNHKEKKKAVFLCIITLLIWFGDYNIFMDGFGVMHSGYLGTSIRSMILLPYTITMCLREKWMMVVLCVIAEACIVWTLYGFGACFGVAVLMITVKIVMNQNIWKKWSER